ncbi:MAG: DUF4364 family protein [Oscillibacter sp.]|nr:DUF4364 family protein [Oscillibacter sp.]
MPRHGFIQDKLEIKFLILYLMSRIIEPLPFDAILDLTMCDNAIDYFDFCECLKDLVSSENLSVGEGELYAITDKGRRNSEICESSLPYSVRLRCDKNLFDWNRKLRRKSQVRATVTDAANGASTVRLSLDDDSGNVMDLKFLVPRRDMGEVIAERFQTAPEKLYSRIVDLLLSSEEPSDKDESQ